MYIQELLKVFQEDIIKLITPALTKILSQHGYMYYILTRLTLQHVSPKRKQKHNDFALLMALLSESRGIACA